MEDTQVLPKRTSLLSVVKNWIYLTVMLRMISEKINVKI